MTEGLSETQMKATKDSPIEEWSNDDVINWITQVYSNKPKRQELLVNSIRDNEYTGEELLSCNNYAELMEALDITKAIIAKQLFKQMKQVKDRAIAQIVEQAQSESNLKMNDTKDLDYLIKIYEDLFPVQRKNDIKEDDLKDNGPIQQFIDTVKSCAHTIKEFVKSLMDFGGSNNLTQRIINICMKYYTLLGKTLQTFTSYGGEIKQLHQCMTEISNIFLLPVQVKNILHKLDETSRHKMIIKLRETTCDGLRNATKRYKKSLERIETERIPLLRALGDEWTDLYQRILNLLNVLKKDKESKQENLGKSANQEKVYTLVDKLGCVAKYAGGFCLKWIGTPLTFGLYMTAAFASGAMIGAGIAACVTGVGVGAGVGLITLGLAGAAGGIATVDKAVKGCINKGNELMDRGSEQLDEMKRIEKTEENIQQIQLMQKSLGRMANVSHAMSSVIKTELFNFQKLKQHNPDSQIQCGGFNAIEVLFAPSKENKILDRIQRLGESILNSTKYLEQSKSNIEIVEKACQKEMKNFGRYIHQPLLRMLTAEKKFTK